MDLMEILGPKHGDSFRYRMLSRMRSDCDYYLGYGRAFKKHLWAGNEEDQIAAMKAIWESFPEDAKPQWLTMGDILLYERSMAVHKAIRDCMKPEKETRAVYPFALTFDQIFERSDQMMHGIAEKCAGRTDTESVHMAILAVVGPNPALSKEVPAWNEQ